MEPNFELNLSKVSKMIGNEILAYFTSIKPILEGWDLLTLFAPAQNLSNGIEPKLDLKLPKGIEHHW